MFLGVHEILLSTKKTAGIVLILHKVMGVIATKVTKNYPNVMVFVLRFSHNFRLIVGGPSVLSCNVPVAKNTIPINGFVANLALCLLRSNGHASHLISRALALV